MVWPLRFYWSALAGEQSLALSRRPPNPGASTSDEKSQTGDSKLAIRRTVDSDPHILSAYNETAAMQTVAFNTGTRAGRSPRAYNCSAAVCVGQFDFELQCLSRLDGRKGARPSDAARSFAQATIRKAEVAVEEPVLGGVQAAGVQYPLVTDDLIQGAPGPRQGFQATTDTQAQTHVVVVRKIVLPFFVGIKQEQFVGSELS